MSSSPELGKAKKSTYSIVIRDAWCKGCGFCVSFCPKEVLSMEGHRPVVARPEHCNGCTLCVLICPDFALKVSPDENHANPAADTE